jgi:hypothetical protein
MCFSSSAIEQQAYRFTEKIHSLSVYKILQIDFIGDQKPVEISHDQTLESQMVLGRELPLIKNIILVDPNGKKFSIEPNEFGLQFASGEMTYQQYVRTKKGEVRKLLLYTLGSVCLFTFFAGLFIKNFL